MLDSVAAILTYQAGICFATGQAPPRLGNHPPDEFVPYETLTASDGELVVAAGNDTLFARFCDVIGAPELAGDPRFAANQGRVENQDALRPLLAARLRTQSRRHWLDRLKQAGVPCGRGSRSGRGAVRPAASGPHDGASDDPPTPLDRYRSSAYRSSCPAPPAACAPRRRCSGSHTRAVLGGLGYDADRIAALEQSGVI